MIYAGEHNSSSFLFIIKYLKKKKKNAVKQAQIHNCTYIRYTYYIYIYILYIYYIYLLQHTPCSIARPFTSPSPFPCDQQTVHNHDPT